MEHVFRQSVRVFLTILLLLCFLGVRGYIYDNPLNWANGGFFCGGCLQSPVNLITITAERVKLSPLVLTNYEKRNEIRLSNNGDNLIIDVNLFVNATVTGGNNNELFKADMVYFHWYAEHAINFKSYELEMQIVHHNIGYSSIESAYEGSNGFLNFGIFFRGVQKDRKVPAGIKAICNSLDSIRYAGTSTTLDNFALQSLFTGLDLNEYFTYCGSYTVPPCTPNVLWIVFTKPLDISSSCLQKLRAMVSNNGMNMTDTRRPTQLEGRRRIFYNVRPDAK